MLSCNGPQALRVIAQLSTTGLQIPVMFFLAQGFAANGSTSAGAVSLAMTIASGVGLAVFFLFCVLGKHHHHRCRLATAPTRNGAKLLAGGVVLNFQTIGTGTPSDKLPAPSGDPATCLDQICCMHYHVVWQ